MIGLLGQIPTARAHSAAGDSTPDPAVESGAPDGGGHLRSFPGSIQAVSDDPNATGWHIARRNLSDAELAAPIDFRISLKMRDLAGLQARILGGQHVSQAEMEAEYLPDKSAYDNLVTWLTANGFAITLVDRNHTTVYARAPASRIAGILGTTFARVSRNREEFTSAITAPSLPESLAGQVLSISGLQTHRRLTRTPLTHVQPQLFTGGTYPPYATPVDIQAAYDFPANLDGTGQTIALYEDALPGSTAEFTFFWNLIGSSQSVSRVTIVRPDQNLLPDYSSGEPETALDVEWAGALAPGAAIRIYVDADIMVGIGAVLNDAPTTPGLTVLSVSFAGPESDSYDPSYSQTFAQLAAAGVTVVASGGDDAQVFGISTVTGVEYPASDPSVTGAGGTTLNFNSAGTAVSEAAFDYSGPYSSVVNVAGASSLFAIPSWQASAIAAAAAGNPPQTFGDGLHRIVPDVAAFAIGVQGGSTYTYALDYDSNLAVNRFDAVYGTSVSAPIWAGVAALINQERARLGKPPVGALNPLLYPSLALDSYNLPPPFPMPAQAGGAAASYQAGTGLGSPDVSELVLCLADEFYAYATQWSALIAPGGTVGLNAQASSAGAAFQWQVDSGSGWTNLSDGPNAGLASAYSGSASANLELTALSGFPGTYRYRALATNAQGVTAPTGPVPVSAAQPPTGSAVETPPASPVPPGTLLSLSVSGSAAPGQGSSADFQWELNGVPISGATGPTYQQQVTPASQGTYSVVITDSVFPTLSATVNVGLLTVALPDQYYRVSLLAGGPSGFQDGSGASARFGGSLGLAVDTKGDVFVADTVNNAVRMITPAGVTTTLAGQAASGNADGAGASARFDGPQGLAVDSSGNVYVADTENNAVRKITSGGTVTTLAGGTPGYADGSGSAAKFSLPGAIAVDGTGTIFVADTGNSRIRSLTPAGLVTTLVSISSPTGVALDLSGNLFAVSSSDAVSEVAAGSSQATAAAQGPYAYSSLTGVAVDSLENLYVLDQFGIWEARLGGSATNLVADVGASGTTAIGGVASGAAGNIYYSTTSTDPASAAVYVASPVAIVTQPAPIAPVFPGSSVVMTVTPSASAGQASFQWQLNGVAIPGATQATLTLKDAGSADRGNYSVDVVNADGSFVLGAGTLGVAQTDAWLSNLSARAEVETGSNVLISGYVIAAGSNSTNKNVLVTGKGPVLQPAGIANFLPNPVLTLYDGQSEPIASDTGWNNPPVASTGPGASPLAATLPINGVSKQLITSASGGAPAQGSADSMLVGALPAGAYSSIVSDANGKSGVGITEVFDVDSLLGNAGNTARLSNVSARSFVGTGNEVLIVGFVVAGGPSGAPETVMIRGQGPNLALAGVPGTLTQTHITLNDSASAPIATDSGWQNAPTYAGGAGASPLVASGIGLESASAVLQQQYAGNSLGAGSADSALVATLPPGAYTVILDSGSTLTGVGLVEVFELR
jgi:sugar lactone lactonase YvrE